MDNATLCVCMYVCVYVSMYVCILCMYGMCVCMYECMYLLFMYLCVCIPMYYNICMSALHVGIMYVSKLSI